jgi:hypothetical protein
VSVCAVCAGTRSCCAGDPFFRALERPG